MTKNNDDTKTKVDDTQADKGTAKENQQKKAEEKPAAQKSPAELKAERRAVKLAEKGQTYIYCGPNIPNIVRQFSIYKVNIPKQLAELAKECKSIEKLIVKPSELIIIKRQLQDNTTPAAINYKKVIKYIKTKGE